MNVGNTVFSQQMSLVSDYEFGECIDRYNSSCARQLKCRDQFLVMSYAQSTSSSSLNSIGTLLTAFNSILYYARMTIMQKSTLADMKERKDWRI